MNKMPKWLPYAMIAAALALLVLASLPGPQPVGPAEISYSDFKSRIADGQVTKVILRGDEAEAILAGSAAYLIHEGPSGQAVWAYLPDEERTVRLNARSAAGHAHISRTAISYEDLRYLPLNLAAAESRAAADAKLGDRAVAVVQLGLPAKAESRYERIVARVDRKSCVPLEIEFWESGEKQSKTLRADPDTIRETGGTRLAHALVVEDHSRGVQTEVVVGKVEMDPELPERMFEAPLRRSHCPR